MIADLEADPERFHSEKLENQAILLSNMLKDININMIIGLADTEPDFLEIFCVTEDKVSDWSITTKFKIQDLLIRVYNKEADRKASTQSGLKRLAILALMVMSSVIKSSGGDGVLRSFLREDRLLWN